MSGHAQGLVVVEPRRDDAIPPLATIECQRVDEFNVHLVNMEPFGRLCGVVEVVSEEIKRSDRERRTFAAKCMIHLRAGANVVLLDAITNPVLSTTNSAVTTPCARVRFRHEGVSISGQ